METSTKPLFFKEQLEKHWQNGEALKVDDKEYGVTRNSVKRYCLVPFDKYKKLNERRANTTGELPLIKIGYNTYEISNVINTLKK